MLDHVSTTVPNLTVAEIFYDAVMASLGFDKVGSDHSEGWLGYGLRCDADHPDRSYLSIRTGSEPTDTHGRHWCLKATSRAVIEDFWHTGLAHGGRDNGAPGLRPTYRPAYFAAFLFDPAGNRIEAVCHRDPTAGPPDTG